MELTTAAAPQRISSVPSNPAKPLSQRLVSLDAYRGFVMFLMTAEVMRFYRVAAAKPGSAFWGFLARHQTHVEWVGCSLHDLIQPSFSFMVGVALPFSLAGRVARGESRAWMFAHTLWRSLILILLGVFLRSVDRSQTYWTFEDTLTQIGLGYPFLFLLALRPTRELWITLAVILVGYWAAFALYPAPSPGFDYSQVGVAWTWPHFLQGFAAHWNKNSNLAWAFDTWFLNLFPRDRRFLYNGGGYATLSFVPTLGTMILGLVAGRVLRGDRRALAKAGWMAAAGVIGLVVGAGLGYVGVCPVVKRIWTPSWVLFSGGWCFLLMAGFYVVLDIFNVRRWAFPLVVIGMNSIGAYLMAHLFEEFFLKSLVTHLGRRTFKVFGDAYEPVVLGAGVLVLWWLILFWAYRRKLFLRI